MARHAGRAVRMEDAQGASRRRRAHAWRAERSLSAAEPSIALDRPEQLSLVCVARHTAARRERCSAPRGHSGGCE